MLPCVISIIPGEHPEIVDFENDRSPNSTLTEFLRKSISHQYKDITVDQVKSLVENQSDKNTFILIGTNNVPIPFLFLSSYYKDSINFLRTEPKYKREILEHYDDSKLMGIFVPEKSMNLKHRFFHGAPNKHNL